ncbi:hypothetical protein K435DRAFT_844522, partial [Dendrothele bispora CBS 962.96]
MSHIFTLDALARSKVCLEFVNQEQPPSIYWKPRAEPLLLNSSASSLSIRVNQAFVNGRPSLTLFLIHEPELEDQAQKSTLNCPDSIQIDKNPRQVVDNKIYSAQENLSAISEFDTPSHTLFPNSSATVSSTTALGFDFDTEQWASADAHHSLPKSDRDSSTSTSCDDLRFLDLSNDDSGSTLFSSLSSLGMFFGTNDHDSPGEWAEVASVTPSPSTSLRDIGSEEAWSDHSGTSVDSDSTTTTGLKEPTSVNRTRSNSRAIRRESGYRSSGGVQSRTNVAAKKRRVQCSLCDETFSRRHDMMRHEPTREKARLDLRAIENPRMTGGN